jgi:putative DNA primase/helicase
MNYEKIPDELKSYRHWVLWKTEHRDGKPTKVPYQTNGRHADTTKSRTWNTFENVVSTFNNDGGYDGIGFVFTNTPIIGIDIDHCYDDNGQLASDAIRIIETIDGYAETSQSGKGVHILCEGKLPPGRRRRGNIEMYGHGSPRYFVMTGDELWNAPIRERQAEINAIHARYLADATASLPVSTADSPLSDNDVIRIASNAKNGDKFKRLWSGDKSDYSGDDSAADLALCNLLAFYTRCDREQTDQLFRQSGLMRPKWERADYRNWTLDKAINECTDVYGFSEISAQDGGYEPGDHTDSGNAEVFARVYRSRVFYCKELGWGIWTGQVWKINDLKAKNFAVQLAGLMLVEARKKTAADAETAKPFLKHALKTRSNASLDSMLNVAKTLDSILLPLDKLDADPFALNTPAGIVNLKTGHIEPHDPNCYCTKITRCAPSKNNAEMWNQFLNFITVGDVSLQNYHQEIAGMAAIGQVYNESLIIAWGNGENGKSTFYNTIKDVLGDYAGQIDSEVLTVNNKNKGPALAELRGKRFILAAESENNVRLSVSMLKQLAATDDITAEQKYKDPISFAPTHSLVWFTNYLPKVISSDHGTWRRLTVAPFNAKIDSSQKKEHYKLELIEKAGGAVMQWIIDGAVRFCQNKFHLNKPDAVKKASETYRADNDTLADFIAECCVVDERCETPAREMYQAYRKWAEEQGIRHPMGFKTFPHEMEQHGYKRKNIHEKIIWLGLGLRSNQTFYTKTEIRTF